jgi:hypothetical protein
MSSTNILCIFSSFSWQCLNMFPHFMLTFFST